MYFYCKQLPTPTFCPCSLYHTLGPITPHPMAFTDPDEKFKYIEVEVHETAEDPSLDSHADMERPLQYEAEETAQRSRQAAKPGKTERKNKFGWAFFLASLFLGLGITATLETPMGLFAGLGIGFLFFVDPIYNKVMDWLDRL